MRGLRALVLGQGLDAASFAVFLLLYPAMAHSEMNPLIGATYAVGGVLAVVTIKVGTALAAVYWVRRAVKPSRAVPVVVLLAAISGAIGAGGNIASLWFTLHR